MVAARFNSIRYIFSRQTVHKNSDFFPHHKNVIVACQKRLPFNNVTNYTYGERELKHFHKIIKVLEFLYPFSYALPRRENEKKERQKLKRPLIWHEKYMEMTQAWLNTKYKSINFLPHLLSIYILSLHWDTPHPLCPYASSKSDIFHFINLMPRIIVQPTHAFAYGYVHVTVSNNVRALGWKLYGNKFFARRLAIKFQYTECGIECSCFNR